MGSGTGAVQETVEALNARGERVGLLKIRLFRPFPSAAVLASLPPTVQRIAVLDRTKEPGATGEPLYSDVIVTLAESGAPLPVVVGGRYGLSSKEFTPRMVKGIFDELARPAPKARLTVGIHDDVTHTSLPGPPREIQPTASVRETARLMRAHDVSRLIVVDDSQIVGIVTRHDVAQRSCAGIWTPNSSSGRC